MSKQMIEISLEEYKELILNRDNKLRDTEKILLERIIEYIKEHIKYEKDGWSTVKGLSFTNFEEKELLRMIQYIDGYLFIDIYKYATDKEYKKQQDELKMERLRNIKELKKELGESDE